MSYRLVVKDAFWQIIGRVLSALGGFIVIKMMTPYLGPLRYGDYSTILKYFAIWSAFADFGIYVIALKKLGEIKEKSQEKLENLYGKIISTRFLMILIVYSLALIVSYFIPAYTSNPYIIRGLPFGMLFSASFMAAGILQIPLQLFWKMEQLSIALVVARIAQILIMIFVIYIFFQGVKFNGSNVSIIAFLLILISVIASGVAQAIYVVWKGNKYMKIKWNFDFSFTKKIIFDNWKYGLSYYLSSFHTLVVLILLGWFYPTIDNYTYVGIWALGLALIEILLIVPSALGNSFIHKIGDYNIQDKLKSFGNLLIFIIWIGFSFFLNFWIFSPSIIYFVGGTEYLSQGNTIGAEVILPFLGFVLSLSFIKQIFNYIFVATEHQNKLLKINLSGVIIGTIVGIPLIMKYNMVGGIITQTLLEILFVGGAFSVAIRNKVFPKIDYKNLLEILSIIIIFAIGGKYLLNFEYNNIFLFFISGVLFNTFLLAFSYKSIKKILKGL